jgi:predicted transcriptional regulator
MQKNANCKQRVVCYNSSTMSSVTFTIDNETREQIDTLARITRKPKETVLQEVVKTGLKSYHTTPSKGVKALLDLAEWAEKNDKRGPKDLSTNHNKYAWEE